MSETLSMKAELTDKQAIIAAAKRLGLRVEEGTFKLYRTEETGIGVFLEGWTYPAVIKADGSVAYDCYKGHWGDEKKLTGEFTAYYTVEKAKIEAWQKGYAVTETYNELTKDLELTVQIGA